MVPFEGALCVGTNAAWIETACSKTMPMSRIEVLHCSSPLKRGIEIAGRVAKPSQNSSGLSEILAHTMLKSEAGGISPRPLALGFTGALRTCSNGHSQRSCEPELSSGRQSATSRPKCLPSLQPMCTVRQGQPSQRLPIHCIAHADAQQLSCFSSTQKSDLELSLLQPTAI